MDAELRAVLRETVQEIFQYFLWTIEYIFSMLFQYFLCTIQDLVQWRETS
jgi:hypothetical protein